MKYFIIPMLVLMPFAAGASDLSAINTQLGTVGETSYGSATPTDLLSIIGTIINVLLGLLGVIFLLLTIYAGFLWMTSSGNEETVTKAKGILKTAIIGLVITLAAYSIAGFVIQQISCATGATTSGC